MGAGRHHNRDLQMRQRIAQEAARLIATEGIRDFLAAKRKAAAHLGAPDTRNLPRNREVEQALIRYQRLFHEDAQAGRLRQLRRAALAAMRFFAPFRPRLTGSVLTGTAGRFSDVNLHLFAPTPERVALFLMEAGIPFEEGHRRLRMGRAEWRDLPWVRFEAGGDTIEALIFPDEGARQAPRSPVDGRPMDRAGIERVEQLLAEEEAGPD